MGTHLDITDLHHKTIWAPGANEIMKKLYLFAVRLTLILVCSPLFIRPIGRQQQGLNCKSYPNCSNSIMNPDFHQILWMLWLSWDWLNQTSFSCRWEVCWGFLLKSRITFNPSVCDDSASMPRKWTFVHIINWASCVKSVQVPWKIPCFSFKPPLDMFSTMAIAG